MNRRRESKSERAFRKRIAALLFNLKSQFQKIDCVHRSGRFLIQGKSKTWSGLQVLLSSLNGLIADQRSFHSIQLRIEAGAENTIFETQYRKQECDHDSFSPQCHR